MMDDDFEGMVCICGEQVVQMHSDCRALMTRDEYERFVGKRPETRLDRI